MSCIISPRLESITPTSYSRIQISQCYDEIFVTLAEYTDQYVDYLQGKAGSGQSFLRMWSFDRYVTGEPDDMIELCRVINVLLPSAANSMLKAFELKPSVDASGPENSSAVNKTTDDDPKMLNQSNEMQLLEELPSPPESAPQRPKQPAKPLQQRSQQQPQLKLRRRSQTLADPSSTVQARHDVQPQAKPLGWKQHKDPHASSPKRRPVQLQKASSVASRTCATVQLYGGLDLPPYSHLFSPELPDQKITALSDAARLRKSRFVPQMPHSVSCLPLRRSETLVARLGAAKSPKLRPVPSTRVC